LYSAGIHAASEAVATAVIVDYRDVIESDYLAGWRSARYAYTEEYLRLGEYLYHAILLRSKAVNLRLLNAFTNLKVMGWVFLAFHAMASIFS
jgi:hypothetical protein